MDQGSPRGVNPSLFWAYNGGLAPHPFNTQVDIEFWVYKIKIISPKKILLNFFSIFLFLTEKWSKSGKILKISLTNA